MKVERRQPVCAGWAAITSSRLVVRRVLERKPACCDRPYGGAHGEYSTGA